MPSLSVYIACFAVGVVGALVIVWLRWIGTLPRFSSSVEIAGLEDEYKGLKDLIAKKEKDGKNITGAEVDHSENLRKGIWKQRWSSFAISSLVYPILGGATAVLFVGIGTENVTDPLVIGKLLAAGALWTSFYSFIDVRKTDEALNSVREETDKVTIERLDEATNDYITLKSAYDKVTNKATQATKKIEEITADYNEALDELKAAESD